MDIFNFVPVPGIFIMEKSLNSSILNPDFRDRLKDMFKRVLVINPTKDIHSYDA